MGVIDRVGARAGLCEDLGMYVVLLLLMPPVRSRSLVPDHRFFAITVVTRHSSV